MEMVKCLPEFEHFTACLKNRNFISKIRRSKITDYAALNELGKREKCMVCQAFYLFFATSFISSVIQEHKC